MKIKVSYLLNPYGDLCKKKIVNNISLSEFIVEDSRQAKFNCVEKSYAMCIFQNTLGFFRVVLQSSTIFICLVKCLLVPKILRILIHLNFLYYPRVMYLAKHGNTQFFSSPIFGLLWKTKKWGLASSKSRWTLGQAPLC